MSAFRRLEVLRQAYQEAARRMAGEADYPDFFVEGSGPPWHERWPELAAGTRVFGDERMLYVDRLGAAGYPDFFVEGADPPWHERWPEAASGSGFDPGVAQHRIRVLRSLNVIQAFERMRERS